jgi:hypothetical protein
MWGRSRRNPQRQTGGFSQLVSAHFPNVVGNRPSVHPRFAWKFAITQTRSADYPDDFRAGDQNWAGVVRLCSNLGAFVKLVAW